MPPQIPINMRPIRPSDDAALAQLIKNVMPEFGADGPGFAVHDEEVNAMYQAYNQPRASYLVLEQEGRIVGGAGIGPLAGGDDSVCELKKMYFYPEARGRGLGAALLTSLLDQARAFGYRQCYLETLDRMEGANLLYQKFGFAPLKQPLGATGHFGCDRWLIKLL